MPRRAGAAVGALALLCRLGGLQPRGGVEASVASGGILPPALGCTTAAHSVEVAEAAAGIFTCPEYFSARACCPSEEVAAVAAKIEDVSGFVQRVLEENRMGLVEGPQVTGDACAEYYTRLFASRAALFEAARVTAERGAEALHSTALILLCSACFVCRRPLKVEQVQNFTQRTLLSIQDRMGAIFMEQMAADEPPDPSCALPYVDALSAGTPFPAFARFVPDMDPQSGDLNNTFAEWLDRCLSLLLELPGALAFQNSLLQWAFFYRMRPDSDAFALLHTGPRERSAEGGAEGSGWPPSPAPPLPQVCQGEGADAAGADCERLELCPEGPRRLLVVVPRDAPNAPCARARRTLEEGAPAWDVWWVAIAPAHLEVLKRNVSADKTLLWRRFQVNDLDKYAAGLCRNQATWVANWTEVGDAEQVAAMLQRIAAEPREEDLDPAAWPPGIRPARRLADAGPWPSAAVRAYLQAHVAFSAALQRGAQPPAGSRVLIYTCTSVTFCGGHGDRLNGMLSAFVVALLAGRLFFIDAQRPVPLSLVLEPQVLDWRLFGTLATMPAAHNWNDKLAAFEADPRRVLDSQAEALRFLSNQRLTPAMLKAAPRQAEALGLSGHPRLHAELFRTLFGPSAALQARLAARGLPEGRLIGIHFRAGDQMPQHWTDPPRHSLDELDEFLDCAESFEASLRWDASLVLFADTDRVLELPRVEALRASGKLHWPARTDTLVHLDRSPATLLVRGLLGVWADWWTLAFDVDALVLCHSGFGATALEVGPPRPAFLGRGCVRADGTTG